MSFIKSISLEGTMNVKSILINEGFIKENDVYKMVILHNQYIIEISIYEKRVTIELFEKGK